MCKSHNNRDKSHDFQTISGLRMLCLISHYSLLFFVAILFGCFTAQLLSGARGQEAQLCAPGQRHS